MQQGWGKFALKLLFYATMALFFTGVIFVSASKAQASTDQIVINEIYPNPTGVAPDNFEWIEIYNPTGVPLDFSTNFSLKKTTSNTPKILSVANCSTTDDIYYVCNLGNAWLVNSGATISLLKNSVIIDQVTYGAQVLNAPVPNQGQSISRIPDGQDTDSDVADFQVAPVTKGSENLLPPPVAYSDQIYINELLPQPADGSSNEFIELYNSSDKDEDLINWQLDAGTFEISTIIKAKEYRVFKNPEIKIGLTDTGDTTNLIDPNGDIKSTITYGRTIRGQSYSKFSDGWFWTTTLTPTAENMLTIETVVQDQDTPLFETDIAGARNQPDGETVQVTGIVTVPSGKLSSQYFYIQDGGSGIQIYNYNKDFPALNAGDEIRVIGQMATISGERRIKILQLADIVIISTRPPPEPVLTTIDQINESFEGEYIELTGVVTKTSGNTFYIHGSGEIQVSIRTGTGIKKPAMHVGDKVQIAGILSQYGDNYRILPIVQGDVKIISSSRLPKSGSGIGYVIIISLILSWTTLVTLLKRQRI